MAVMGYDTVLFNGTSEDAYIEMTGEFDSEFTLIYYVDNVVYTQTLRNIENIIGGNGDDIFRKFTGDEEI